MFSLADVISNTTGPFRHESPDGVRRFTCLGDGDQAIDMAFAQERAKQHRGRVFVAVAACRESRLLLSNQDDFVLEAVLAVRRNR